MAVRAGQLPCIKSLASQAKMIMSTTKYRRDCFDAHKKVDETGRIYLVCYLCKGRIDPARDAWDAEHTKRKTLGGSDSPENVWPAHKGCHQPKTARDLTENAKGKRVSDKHFGIVRKKGF